MKKAVGYVRVSKEDKDRGNFSPEMQRSKITGYCQFYELDLVHIEERDEFVSAKDIKGRPGVKKIFDMARSGEVEAIVVYKLDRLFRNRIEALVIEEELRNLGVSICSVTEYIDTTTAMGRMIYTLIINQAAFEREHTSDRTKDVLRHKKNAGEVYNGNTLFGWDPKGGKLVENEAEQETIKLIIKWKAEESKSLTWIAKQLNGMGVKTKKRKAWYPQTVSNVITLAKEREEG
jgi:site-specific DNA recombinase